MGEKEETDPEDDPAGRESPSNARRLRGRKNNKTLKSAHFLATTRA
jgi:hypothetical protein